MSSTRNAQYNLTVSNPNKVQLTDRKDWDEWYTAFALKARHLFLWDYVTNEGPRKVVPERPVIPQRSVSLSRTATPGVDGRASTSRRRAANTSPPDEEERRLSAADYASELAVYDREEKLWRELVRAKHELLDWVLETVDRRLQNLHIKQTDDVVEIVDNLREYLRVTDSDRRIEVRQDYQMILKKFGGSATKIHGWVREWEDIIKKGSLYGISETKDSETWLQDLLQACSKEEITKGWAQNFRMNKKALVHAGVLSALDVSYDLRDHLEQCIRDGQMKKKSGFPTYNEKNDDPTDIEDDEPQPKEKKARRQGHRNQPTAQSKKRKFDGPQQQEGRKKGTKVETCLACGQQGHGLDRCYYAFPETKPDYFVPNSGWKEACKMRLTHNIEGARDAFLAEKKRREAGKTNDRRN